MHHDPANLDRTVTLANGTTVRVRPIEPRDARALKDAFDRHVTLDDSRFRLFVPVREMTEQAARRFAELDREREMCLILVDPEDPGEIWGGARITRIEGRADTAEFAVSLRSDLKRQGLGSLVLGQVLDYARSIGVKTVYGDVLSDNTGMRALAARLGFREQRNPEDLALIRVIKALDD